eukprot:TRINITY_DN26071_c0_g1_i1.p1 TRINITY_DN26071_c0_g1~~TRINITY_DN26071_c0_g1_i1.p1  ORF type:complete len:761 (+),score=153.27 TRINITY_DN26071_c0_g1_i1:74-2356(+)
MLTARSYGGSGSYPTAQVVLKGQASPPMSARALAPCSVQALPTPARSMASAARYAMDVSAQMPYGQAARAGPPPPVPSSRGIPPRSPVLTSRSDTPRMASGSYAPPPLRGATTPSMPVFQPQRQRSASAAALPGMRRPRPEAAVHNTGSFVPVASVVTNPMASPELAPRAEVCVQEDLPPFMRGGDMRLPPPRVQPPAMGAAQSWSPPLRRDEAQGPPAGFPQCQSLVVDMATPSWAPPPVATAAPVTQQDLQRGLPQCQSLVVDMSHPQRGLPQCQSLVVDMNAPGNLHPQMNQGLPQCQSLVVDMGAGAGLPQSQSLVVDAAQAASGTALPQCQSLVVDMGHAAAPPQGVAGCQTMIATPETQQMAAIAQRFAPNNQQNIANCQSMVATYPEYMLAQGKKHQAEYGPLRFASAFHSRQHPAKSHTGIPNADAVLEGIDYLGVADGVSGVHGLGLRPDALPWELLRSCGKKLFAAAAKDEPKANADLGAWLVDLIQESYDATEELGATTLLLAALKGSNLVTACLGDSAILVLRPTSINPLRLQSIFKTEPGRYDARRPVQVQRLQGLDVAGAHEVIKGAVIGMNVVQPGDMLVLGSDGLFDNLSDDDITQVIEKCCCEATGSSEELQQAATNLVDLAIARVRTGRNDSNQQPWQQNSGTVPANNADDTTALVAMIQAEAVAPVAEVVSQLDIDQDRRKRQVGKKRNKNGLFSTCGVSLDRMVTDGARGSSARGQGSKSRSMSAGAVPRGKNKEECVIS